MKNNCDICEHHEEFGFCIVGEDNCCDFIHKSCIGCVYRRVETGECVIYPLKCNFKSDKDPGLKHDTGKLRYDLIPPLALRAMAKVLTFGAKKYKDNGWKEVKDIKVLYTAALFRHIEAWRSGETYDEESNIHHLAHALCNIVFLLWDSVIRAKGPLERQTGDMTEEEYIRCREKM